MWAFVFLELSYCVLGSSITFLADKEGRELINEHYNSDYRVRTVSVRLLEFHALYSELFADALIEKALGHDEAAMALKEKMKAEVGKYEAYFERYYDHGLDSQFGQESM